MMVTAAQIVTQAPKFLEIGFSMYCLVLKKKYPGLTQKIFKSESLGCRTF